MRSYSRVSSILFAIFVCLVCAPAAAQTLPPPVHVAACDPQPPSVVVPGYVHGFYPVGPYYWHDVYGYRFLEPPITNNPTLSIDYFNVSPKVATEVEFGLVARGHLVAEVRDVGTFSPNAEIKHTFGLNPNVFPLGTGLAACVPLRVTFADATTWINPHLPAFRSSIYR